MKIHELLPSWMTGAVMIDGERTIVQYKFISPEYIACKQNDGIVVRKHCRELLAFKISE